MSRTNKNIHRKEKYKKKYRCFKLSKIMFNNNEQIGVEVLKAVTTVPTTYYRPICCFVLFVNKINDVVLEWLAYA